MKTNFMTALFFAYATAYVFMPTNYAHPMQLPNQQSQELITTLCQLKLQITRCLNNNIPMIEIAVFIEKKAPENLLHETFSSFIYPFGHTHYRNEFESALSLFRNELTPSAQAAYLLASLKLLLLNMETPLDTKIYFFKKLVAFIDELIYEVTTNPTEDQVFANAIAQIDGHFEPMMAE